MKQKNDVALYFENISLLLMGILLLAFPLVFTVKTTDAFSLPKQILIGTTVLVSLLLLAAKTISHQTVRIRKTPFDLPVLIFGLVIFLSSLFSLNRYDSLTSFFTLLFALLAFFVVVQLAKSESSIIFLLSSLFTGASLASLPTIAIVFSTLLFQKPFYILPFEYTHNPSFTLFGAHLDQAIFLGLTLLASLHFVFPHLAKRKKMTGLDIAFSVSSIVLFIGFVSTLYQIFTLQKPLILPFEIGMQTAFAAISQDTGRVLKGFLFGSGFGTYLVDFTRFKPAAFNLNQSLWSLTFFRSSSFFLELLATSGILGILSYIWIVINFVKSRNQGSVLGNPLYITLAAAFAASFLLPFSATIQTILFVLLGLFASVQALRDHKKYFDVELYFVAFKKGLFVMQQAEGKTSESPMVNQQEHSFTKFLPVSLFIFTSLFVGLVGYFVFLYTASDILFQSSLVAASSNKGLETYNNEIKAITLFPWRDGYHRIYSQTNIAIANSLSSSTPAGASPSAEIQQTILTLIQQSIRAGRTATTLAPLNTLNWQNLASIYRSLIGFGQNAENFALLASQQAIALDPNNPQGYLNLGGIYYQQGKWAEAQRQFQIAVNLKPDFANAYYNLGHALQQQGDLQNALSQYRIVKSLSAKDSESLKKIDAEITQLTQKIGDENVTGVKTQKPETVSQNQPPLQISTPSAKLPTQKPQVKIPPPLEATQSGR